MGIYTGVVVGVYTIVVGIYFGVIGVYTIVVGIYFEVIGVYTIVVGGLE